MRGAALHFARRIPEGNYDGLITTSLLSLSDLKALLGLPPALIYFHESQLTYPLAPGEAMDVQFGFTEIISALTAGRVLFNSRSHRDAFFAKLPGFLRMMPDYRPMWVTDSIQAKSGVLYPGCSVPARFDGSNTQGESPPLIIWNHRWEHDKGPEDFFAALERLDRRGLSFRVALLGESFGTVPEVFQHAQKRFGDRIIQFGYVEDKAAYQEWLKRGSIVISTAKQENFGLSVVEAMACGCVPVLPNRLSYPEVLPEAFHGCCLYRDRDELVESVTHFLLDGKDLQKKSAEVSQAMSVYTWEHLIPRYDEELERLVSQPHRTCTERNRGRVRNAHGGSVTQPLS
jgi:glycosyltransferase involved in cell wall biosynthesis